MTNRRSPSRISTPEHPSLPDSPGVAFKIHGDITEPLKLRLTLLLDTHVLTRSSAIRRLIAEHR